MKYLSCREAGKDCDYIAKADTVDEVMKKAAEHGKKVHGMKDAEFTPEMMKKFRALVHDEKSGKAA